jgi:hypothetical protein
MGRYTDTDDRVSGKRVSEWMDRHTVGRWMDGCEWVGGWMDRRIGRW